METNIKNILGEHSLKGREDQQEIVQSVIEKVYPHVVTNLGPSKYREETPSVEVWNDIYARYSGIPEMRGEASKKTKAEWKEEDNKIYIYYLNMEDEEDIIRSLLHEYTHSLQDPDPEKRAEQRKLGYDNDLHEIEAHAAEENWKDYLKYLNINLTEQITNNETIPPTNGFSPQLINYLKYVYTMHVPRGYKGFSRVLSNDLNIADSRIASLYATLLANVDYHNTGGGADGVLKLLEKVPYQNYKITSLYESYIEYKDNYESYAETELCQEESPSYAYGERTENECECYSWEEISVSNEDGEEVTVDCEEATEKQKEEAGVEECQCEEWEDMEVDLYFYPSIHMTTLSWQLVEDEPSHFNELGDEDWDYIVIDRDIDSSRGDYGEAETWDYFSDSEDGDVEYYEQNSEMEKDEVIADISTISRVLQPTQLQEQDEQMSLFPYGEWEFPVGWEEDDDYISEVKNNVPEQVFQKIFHLWDENGIDFSIFKLLGVRVDTVTQIYVLKRYIQNTKKPIPVSYKFDCNDLAELFDLTDMNYSMEYVKDYLCGEDSFWDFEDWYNYEWDDYMSDQIDEKNWETISQIFGGVSQSVAEDILNRSSSSEEVDELTEKYEEEIDEIRNFIMWAHNDEHEYAVKKAIARDIDDKIAQHFGADGRMVEDEKGAKGWIIKDDLRNWVNDQWDNTDTYQYHEDYSSEPIEDWLLDTTIGENILNYIFATLIEEEYRFWSYCEGKQGECLQPDTKYLDGYWHPNYDINHSLSDRLTELSYEPTTQPINEAQEGKDGKDLELNLNADDGYEEYVPFTPTEMGILNIISRQFSLDELKLISTKDSSQWSRALWAKWESAMKLIGERLTDEISIGKSSRWAKWVVDNIQDARTENLDDDSIDFRRMEGENAIKAWPSVYEITGNEEGWEKIYRQGVIDIVAYDSDDADSRGHESFWDYEPEMENVDYGDWEDDSFELDAPKHMKILKENKDLIKIIERYSNHTYNLYEKLVKEGKSRNIITKDYLNEIIKEYINENKLDKNLLYIKEEELLKHLLNKGIIIENKIKNPFLIEEPKTNNWWKNLPKLEKKHILEHGLPPSEDEPPKEIPDFLKKLLVVAKFTSSGTWGVAPSVFLLYMKPNGEIMYVKKSQSLSNVPDQFRVGKSVSFGDLLNFENNSRYDLTMKGNIRETYLSTGRRIIEKHTISVTPQKQFYLKSLLKEMKTDNINDLLKMATDTKMGWQGGPGRKKVFDFLNKLKESGIVNMFQSIDFLWSGSRWLKKWIEFHQPESLEPINEYEDDEITIQHKETIQYLLDNADSVRDVIVSNVIAKAELKGDTSLEGANRLMRPAAKDMVKLWAQYFVR